VPNPIIVVPTGGVILTRAKPAFIASLPFLAADAAVAPAPSALRPRTADALKKSRRFMANPP